MKPKISVFILMMHLTLFINACTNQSTINDEAVSIDAKKESLWTDSLKSNFISTNSNTDFDRFVLREVISQIEFKKSEDELKEYITTVDYEVYKRSMTKFFTVNIDNLARKSEESIERLIGTPNDSEKVNPSNTPCPCNQNTYLDGLVEIVFIKGQADWITVNNGQSKIIVEYPNSYQSVDRFDDYTYVKVNTR